MGGSEGARVIQQLDEKIDRLPGLAGLQLVSRAADGFGVRPGTHPDSSGTGGRLGTLLYFPAISR